MAISPVEVTSTTTEVIIRGPEARKNFFSDREMRIALAIEEKRTESFPNAAVRDSGGRLYGYNLKRSTTLIRATSRAKRKALWNIFAYQKVFKVFETLTFCDPQPDAETARKIWSRFMRELRRIPRYKSNRISYLARLERGARTGRLHFHVLWSRPVYHAKIVWLWRKYGGGWISDYQKLQNEQVLGYILKYTAKTQKRSAGFNNYRKYNDTLTGRRFFWSQGFKVVPNHITIDFKKEEKYHFNEKTNKFSLREEIVGIDWRLKHPIPMKYSTVMLAQPELRFQSYIVPNSFVRIDDGTFYDFVKLPPDYFPNLTEDLLDMDRENLRQFTTDHRKQQKLTGIIKRNFRILERNLKSTWSDLINVVLAEDRFRTSDIYRLDKMSLDEAIVFVYVTSWERRWKHGQKESN